ncbi:MAG: mechanosensitive ion channel family protein [Pseudomonadota bacterium]
MTPRATTGLSRRLVFAVALWLGAGVAGDGPGAQVPGPPAAELEKLLSTLEDDAARQRLIGELRALVEPHRQTAPSPIPERIAGRFLASLSDQLAASGAAIWRAAAVIADAPKLIGWIAEEIGDPGSRARLFEIVWKLAAVFAAGGAAEGVAKRLLRGPRRAIARRPAGAGLARLPVLGLALAVDLAPIAVFAAAAFGALALVEPRRIAAAVALALINATLIGRAVGLIASTLLAPHHAGLRLVPLADETAIYLYVWVRRLANIVVYGFFATEASLMLGMPLAGHVFLLKALGLVVALLLVILILQNRIAVAQAIAPSAATGEEGPRPRRRLVGAYWHVAAVAYVVTVFLVWLVRSEAGLGFMLWGTAFTAFGFGAAWLAVALLRRAVRRAFRITDELARLVPTLQDRANRYLKILDMVATASIYGFAALAILQAWGLGSLDLLATPAGRRVAGSLISIAVTIVVAAVLWEAGNLLLERNFGRATGLEVRRDARLRTLLPLLKRLLLGLVGAFVGLVVLSEIGVNIAPLIAGAGVLGIAVGFGAQTLMKDLIGGVSIILEDSIAIGDVVQLGDKGGVVEWMSMRSIRLRDTNGTVHTIPFSDVQTISNLTKDFSFAVFDIGVGYGEDVDRVGAVLRKAGAELRREPEIGALIREDLEVLGVDRFGDSAVIVKARLKTAPGKQWQVARAFNRAFKLAFEREGIEMPFPQRTVHVVAGGGQTPGDLAAAGAAGSGSS